MHPFCTLKARTECTVEVLMPFEQHVTELLMLHKGEWLSIVVDSEGKPKTRLVAGAFALLLVGA
jgi:hypothetical protein